MSDFDKITDELKQIRDEWLWARPYALLELQHIYAGGVQPANSDGEVSEFYLWPAERVMKTVAATRAFKPNCNLIIIDFLIRHGLIGPDRPDYLEIVQGLRQ